MTEPTYEMRYCAFVDILGFGQLIGELSQRKTQFETLRDVLRKLHSPRYESPIKWGLNDFRALGISDAVAISSACNEHGLGEIFHALDYLTLHLLEQGYFIRGALVKGHLYHDDNIVFGEALIEAFHLEKQVARFPRIIVTNEVAADAESYSKERPWDRNFNACVREADDGLRYVDVLGLVRTIRELEKRLEDDLVAIEFELAFAKASTQIQRKLEESINNPRHFEKVKWFAQYWNDSLPIDALRDNQITGSGLVLKPHIPQTIRTREMQPILVGKFELRDTLLERPG